MNMNYRIGADSDDALVQNIVKYDLPFPLFRFPTIIGYFSLDSQRILHCDISQMKYYVSIDKESINLNLNEGIADAIKKDEDSVKAEKLDRLLQWILLNKDKFQNRDKNSKSVLNSLNTDFICYRGLLTTLMTSPYETSNDWEIHLAVWRGTIYLWQKETFNQRKNRLEMNDLQRRMCSWGYKFEQFMLGNFMDYKKSDKKSPVNENEEFCCVFRTRISSHSIVYGAEMDGYNESTSHGFDPTAPLKAKSFVELKTTRRIDNKRQSKNFRRYKLLKWWSQSFLVGVPTIIVGIRNDVGLVNEIQSLNLSEIREMSEGLWKANVCVNFLDFVLTYIKRQLSCYFGGKIRYFKMHWSPMYSDVPLHLTEGDSEHFLPSWFTDKIFLPSEELLE